MTDTTPNRQYPYPTADSPNKPRLDIEALATALDLDIVAVERRSDSNDAQVKEELIEYVRHEIFDLQQDIAADITAARKYTDEQVQALEERLTAKIEALPVKDTSHLPVIGPWAVAAQQQDIPAPGYIVGGHDGKPEASTYQDLTQWNVVMASLLDSSYHSDNYWENVQPDWLLSYNGPIHRVTWRCTSAAQRNGDAAVNVQVEWVEGTTTDVRDLGTEGYIFCHEKTNPHFPI